MRRKPANGQKVPPKIREAVERRSGGYCEAACNGNCSRQAAPMHHRLPRSAGGPHTEANLLHLCDNCHRYIHAHPGYSYEQGWLVRRQ